LPLLPAATSAVHALYAAYYCSTKLITNVLRLKCDTDARATNADADEVALLAQKFFLGDEETVREVLAREGERLGAPVHVHSFMRLQVGEGIEKKEDNFAAEVMGMIKQ